MKFNTRAFFTPVLTILCAFSALFYSSCRNGGSSPFLDKCASISCAHGGTCDKGNCVCPAGYDGVNCEIVCRDKFISAWNVIEDGSITVEGHYDLAIEKDADVSWVTIKNMYNYFGSVRANIVKDTIYIPNQQMQGKVIVGKGYIYSDTLQPTYTKVCMRYQVIDTASMLVDYFGYYSELNNSKPSIWTKH